MKKSLAVITAISLSLSLVMGTANAEGNSVPTNVNELHEQLSKIDNNASLSAESKEAMVLDTITKAPVEVQQAYTKEVGDTIDRFLKTEGLAVNESGESETIDLGKGTSITFEGEEVIESLEDPSAGEDPVEDWTSVDRNGPIENGDGEGEEFTTNGYKFSPKQTLTKKYGNRSYTVSVTMTSYGVNIGVLKLGNKYTIGSNGLSMRYSTVAGTRGIDIIFQLKSASAKTTDGKAEKVGYDMNATGKYKYFVGVKGIGQTYYSEIRSQIKLVRWNADDKKKKQARVYQGYTWIH